MKLNGYCMSPRGVCKVTYYYEGVAIYFFDKCKREDFKYGKEPKLTFLSLEQAQETGINEIDSYLYSLGLYNEFIKALKKEPKMPLLLVPTFRINKGLIQATDHHNYENNYQLQQIYKPFNSKDQIVLKFSYDINYRDMDDEVCKINDSYSHIYAPESLFTNYNLTDYKQWLDATLAKKIKDLNDQFDERIEEIKKLKKSIQL